jgi:hypothetical protein
MNSPTLEGGTSLKTKNRKALRVERATRTCSPSTPRISWMRFRGSAVRHQRHPPVSHGANQALARRANAFRQDSPRGPTAHPLAPGFSVPCWLVYFIAALVFCALCVGSCTALPCRSRLTVIQRANVRHASRVYDFVLLFVGAQIALSCGSRLTVSQIWRMSPSCLTG